MISLQRYVIFCKIIIVICISFLLCLCIDLVLIIAFSVALFVQRDFIIFILGPGNILRLLSWRLETDLLVLIYATVDRF